MKSLFIVVARITLTLALAVFAVAVNAQCPHPDSVLKYENATGINPIMYPYPYVWTTSVTFALPYNYKPTPPPVNQDPPIGKTYWYAGGKCTILYPDTADSVVLAVGQYANRKKTGKWIWYDMNGNKTHEGIYVNGLKTGKWKEWIDEGTMLSEGSFTNGRKEGKWNTWQLYTNYENTDRILTHTCSYHTGLHNGVEINYSNGIITSSASYIMGLQHGYSKYYYEDGKLQSLTYYVNGHATGKSYEYDYDGKLISEKNYYRGQLHGNHITYQDDAKIIDRYKSGNLHGWHEVWRNNECIEKIWYANGLKNGYYFTASDDYKQFARYKNDSLHGSLRKYRLQDSVWVLFYSCRHAHNVQDSIEFQRTYDNEIILTSYVKGKKHGNLIRRDIFNDTVTFEPYVNDQLHGKVISKSGVARYIAEYKNGIIQYERKYSNGKLVSKRDYRNGIPYDPDFTTQLEDGSLVETYLHANGNKKIEKFFPPENTQPFRLRIRAYYNNGQLEYEQNTSNGQANGVYSRFSYDGDTLLYYSYNDSGYIHGKAIQHEGKILQRGNYTKSVKDGNWKYYYPYKLNNAKVPSDSMQLAAEGRMYKNQPFEHWNYFYPDGKLMYSGCNCGNNNTEYIFNTSLPMWQQHVVVSADGSYKPAQPAADFTIGKPCGNYVWYYPNGKLYQKKNADVTSTYFSDGKLYKHTEGNHYHEYDTTGMLIRAFTPDTTLVNYYESGFRRIIGSNKEFRITKVYTLKNELVSVEQLDLTGRHPEKHFSKTWSDKGILLAESYSRTWITYFEDGSLQRAVSDDSIVEYYPDRKPKTYFVKGKNDNWYRMWHPNGQLKLEYRNVGGYTEGQFKSYYENGQLEETYYGENHQTEGEVLKYYSNGQLKEKRFYKHGLAEGDFISYDEKGTVVSVKKFKDGKEVK